MPAVDYVALAVELADIVSAARVATDRLRRLSYGTDASFYRLIPEIVVIVESEAEVIGVMAACTRTGAPVTFRGRRNISLGPGDHRQRTYYARAMAGRDRPFPTTAG